MNVYGVTMADKHRGNTNKQKNADKQTKETDRQTFIRTDSTYYIKYNLLKTVGLASNK